MKILAFECSAGPASVAIIENGTVLASAFINVKLTHSQTLLPLAKDVLSAAHISFDEIEDFKNIPGKGIVGTVDGKRYYAANESLIEGSEFNVSREEINKYTAEGKTLVFIGDEKGVIAGLTVVDKIRDNAAEVIKDLKGQGVKTIMLTGDNKMAANKVANEIGLDYVYSDLLPEDKLNIVDTIRNKFGDVAMVGDGINDAPALTRADIGIAIGAGTDIAIDAADVVLMKSRLSDVPAAILLSRRTLKNIHENLFWAFIYNIIGIPLAAGMWSPIVGWELNPMFGAAAMSMSSFCVVTNALRLNFLKLHDSVRDKEEKKEKNSVKNKFSHANLCLRPKVCRYRKGMVINMTKTMKIEGMMCGHCEARVKKVLEALPEVEEAVVSHEAGTAVLTLSVEIMNDVLKKTIEDQDYKVLSIE